MFCSRIKEKNKLIMYFVLMIFNTRISVNLVFSSFMNGKYMCFYGVRRVQTFWHKVCISYVYLICERGAGGHPHELLFTYSL